MTATLRLLLLDVGVSRSTRVCHLRARGHVVRVDDITRATRAAAATVTAVCCQRTITAQHGVHHATASHGTITRHWTTSSDPGRQLRRLSHRTHFEAVYIQVVAHLATYFHGKVQQICTAEYLQHTRQYVKHFAECSRVS